jgi:DNA-binding NarL/FixJ family response regulator
MKSLRILLADDHDLLRRGLRTLVESQSGWEVCAEAVTGREAVEKAKVAKPDIVVMDLSMPELNGLEATRQIRKMLPDVEVLILTLHDSDQLVPEMLDAGARGYLLKSDSERELVVAIQALRRHKSYFTSRVTEMLLQGYLKPPGAEEKASRRGGVLTAREREILQLLAEGKSSKEVATVLNISVKTAETHRANIMRKLNLHSMSALVRYAVRNKIIEP